MMVLNKKVNSFKVNMTPRPTERERNRKVFPRKLSTGRPPAVYSNPDPEAIKDKYINMEVPEKKRRKL